MKKKITKEKICAKLNGRIVYLMMEAVEKLIDDMDADMTMRLWAAYMKKCLMENNNRLISDLIILEELLYDYEIASRVAWPNALTNNMKE